MNNTEIAFNPSTILSLYDRLRDLSTDEHRNDVVRHLAGVSKLTPEQEKGAPTAYTYALSLVMRQYPELNGRWNPRLEKDIQVMSGVLGLAYECTQIGDRWRAKLILFCREFCKENYRSFSIKPAETEKERKILLSLCEPHGV